MVGKVGTGIAMLLINILSNQSTIYFLVRDYFYNYTLGID
ncbi:MULTISPECIES: hypothetical protein [unclassified Bartonella]